MKKKIIGEKIFTNKDQAYFAKISKDFNPIHTNPILARRLISGKRIVHGMNILLTTLNLLAKKDSFTFNKIKCDFLNPLFIDEKVKITKKKDKQSMLIEVKNRFKIFASISLQNDTDSTSKSSRMKKRKLNRIKNIERKTINKSFKKITKYNKFTQIELKNFIFSNKYNNTKKYLNNNQFKSVLSLSYFVGMIYPGLNSMLSSVEININQKIKDKENINFSLEIFDKRINLLIIKFSNALEGTIKAFLHSGKTEQLPMQRIKKLIIPKEFSGTNSLIIGGSRGLGELTTKILALGGGNVSFTYSEGLEDSKKIKNEILKTTGEDCKIQKLNILKDNIKNKLNKFLNYDYIFYYPTPKILNNNNKKFNKKIFNSFYLYYVKKFKDMCEFIEKKSNKKKIIFYPSTVFVEEKPKNFKEYVKAKLEAERIISNLNKNYKKVKIVFCRLPALTTDQNSKVISHKKNINDKVLLPVIRKIILGKKYDIKKSFV